MKVENLTESDMQRRNARLMFSGMVARALSLRGPTQLAQYLAREEWVDSPKYVPCNVCPYVSISHHEASLHQRLHS